MIIKNKYLREWIDENYPSMKEDENCLIELDYFDMDRFSEWLVKKLNTPVVSVPKALCKCQDNFEEDRDTKGHIVCVNCKKRVFV